MLANEYSLLQFRKTLNCIPLANLLDLECIIIYNAFNALLGTRFVLACVQRISKIGFAWVLRLYT